MPPPKVDLQSLSNEEEIRANPVPRNPLTLHQKPRRPQQMAVVSLATEEEEGMRCQCKKSLFLSI